MQLKVQDLIKQRNTRMSVVKWVKDKAKKVRDAVKKDREERLHPALKKAGKKYGDRAIKHFKKLKNK